MLVLGNEVGEESIDAFQSLARTGRVTTEMLNQNVLIYREAVI